MARRIAIQLDVDSNGAVEFVRLADASGKAEDSLGKLGATAKRTGDDVDRAGDAARKSSTNWSELGRTAGTAVGAVAILSSKLAGDAEAAEARVSTAFTNAGASIDDYAARVAALGDTSLELGFDDEDATDSLAKIVDATGDVEEAFSRVALAQDIARGRQIDLAAATNIVIAAEQGRYGALTRMGIAIDETASKEEALGALQAKYAGQADAYAETGAASWDRIGNAVENHLERLGGALADFQTPLLALGAGAQVIGPLGDAFEAVGGKAKAASLAASALSVATGPVGLVLAVGAAAAGLYALSQRQSEAEQQAEALTEATDAYTASLQSNTTALISAGAYDITQGTQAYLDTIIENGSIAQGRIDDVSTAMLNLKGLNAEDLGAPLGAIFDGVDVDEYTRAVVAASDANQDGLITAQELAAAQAVLSEGFEVTAGDAANLTRAVSQLTDDIANPELAGGEIAAEVDRIIRAVGDGTLTVQQGIDALNAIETTGLDTYNLALRESEAAAMAAADAYEAFEARRGDRSYVDTITPEIEARDRKLAQLEAENQAEADNVEQRKAHATQDRILAMWGMDDSSARRRALEQEAAAERELHDEARARQQDSAAADAEEAARIGTRGNALRDVTGAEFGLLEAQQGSINARQISIATSAREAAALEAATTQANALASAYESITGRDLDLDAMATGNVSVKLAVDATSATAALENVFRIGVGNLENINSTVAGVVDWATELVNVEGTLGTIDTLLANGEIDAEQHGAMQRNYNRMLEDQASIQAEIANIQADQLPYMELATDRTRDALDLIGDMEGSAQAAALGFMDAGESAKYLEIQTALAAAAAGEMGEGGKASMESMIEGIVATDPYMTAMLEQMGIIELGADGTVTINWEGFDEEGETPLDRLTEQLAMVVGAYEIMLNVDINDDGVIGYVPPELPPVEQPVDPVLNDAETPEFDPLSWPVDLKVDTGDAETGISDVTAQINEWGGLTGTARAAVDNDPAVTGISDVTAQINEWGGLDASATASVNDYASGTLGTIRDLLNAIDGRVATNTVQTNYVSTGSTDVGFTIATGGYVSARDIDTMASGGHSAGRRALVGETGPEFVTLPFGSTVTNSAATSSQMERDGGGGGGDIHIHGPLYVMAATPDIHDAINSELVSQGRR